MKLIIDIPEENYKLICSDGRPFLPSYKWIKNGTPLPKGHGRLIDADKLWDSYHDLDCDFYEALDLVDTIIEADKEQK